MQVSSSSAECRSSMLIIPVERSQQAESFASIPLFLEENGQGILSNKAYQFSKRQHPDLQKLKEDIGESQRGFLISKNTQEILFEMRSDTELDENKMNVGNNDIEIAFRQKLATKQERQKNENNEIPPFGINRQPLHTTRTQISNVKNLEVKKVIFGIGSLKSVYK